MGDERETHKRGGETRVVNIRLGPNVLVPGKALGWRSPLTHSGSSCSELFTLQPARNEPALDLWPNNVPTHRAKPCGALVRSSDLVLRARRVKRDLGRGTSLGLPGQARERQSSSCGSQEAWPAPGESGVTCLLPGASCRPQLPTRPLLLIPGPLSEPARPWLKGLHSRAKLRDTACGGER